VDLRRFDRSWRRWADAVRTALANPPFQRHDRARRCADALPIRAVHYRALVGFRRTILINLFAAGPKNSRFAPIVIPPVWYQQADLLQRLNRDVFIGAASGW